MIFVTGGTGLVGSHILLRLAQAKKEFKALKRKGSSLDVCYKIFHYYGEQEAFKSINWFEGDINDITSLEEGMENCNMLLHCAGLVSFQSVDVDLLNKVNIEGTFNVMNIALSKKVNKVGYVSSIATLGRNSTNKMVDEETHFKITRHESNYAISKYYAEQEVWRACAEGLDVIIVNPSVILGPGNWDKGSSKIFQKIFNGLKFYTKGATGYVDVIDVADALLKLMFSDIKNQRFILNGANLKYRDCFNRIARRMGKPESTIEVGNILKSIAWRLEYIKSFLLGTTPLLTKETANSAMRSHKFSANKISQKLNFSFTDIDDTINKYSDWFISEKKNS